MDRKILLDLCPEPLQMLRKNTPSGKKKVWHVCMVSNFSIPIYLDTNLFYEAKVVTVQASNRIQRCSLWLWVTHPIGYRLLVKPSGA